MAEASARPTSFLGAINPWGSRTSTPPPRSPRQVPAGDEALKPTSGVDHAISARPTPSLRRYPRDCPYLRTRWYYAVDLAKRKPFVPEASAEDKSKPTVVPKKWVQFSTTDSQAIEQAFQQLGRDDEHGEKETSTRIPVNEDYLYDVHIEKRELEPAYWIGPVYDVRRGSWFFQEGSTLRPCDENLSNQLEEGYLKITPWRGKGSALARSASKSRPKQADGESMTLPPPPVVAPEPTISNTYRLFGAHMNTTATYADAMVAYLATDDLMSRVSSTLYGSFGGQAGTKVVRGWSDLVATTVEAKGADATATKSEKRRSKLIANKNIEQDGAEVESDVEAKPKVQRPSALERQLSSLAGLVNTETEDQQKQQEEEQARAEEQKEMEDAREKEGEDQGRKIDHLILVTHGIGQRLGLRLDSINFVHDVNTMRKTMKAVFEHAPDLQALTHDKKNSSVQVLPICWRHLLDFPKQNLKTNRGEHDLADLDSSLEEEYPSLQDITVDGVPAVRNLITDLALDVLLYQSAYREHISKIVLKEVNRVYNLFKTRTGFDGKVSLVGHSLGSAIFFDILCRQPDVIANRPRKVSGAPAQSLVSLDEHKDIRLAFECENFFALGSPIALFQMLKGRTIAGRGTVRNSIAHASSPFDSDPLQNDPFNSADLTAAGKSSLIPVSTSSPRCAEFYNVFHPTDPIAYRCEPLISPAMSSMKSQALPYTKRGLFAAPGMANLTARVGQQVMSGWYNLTSGVASSLINRSLGITGEEQALPQDRKPLPASADQVSTNDFGKDKRAKENLAPTINYSLKQQAIADAAVKAADDDVPPNSTPTLIDAELETLYGGFQKRRRSASSASRSSGPTEDTGTADLEAELVRMQARKLKREEAKVRALNSNGRVDYHIQEGLFDVSLLASIASHLSYWADADVNHFMVGQLLKGSGRRGTSKDDPIDLTS